MLWLWGSAVSHPVSLSAYRDLEHSGKGQTYRRVARYVVENWPKLIDRMRRLNWEHFSLDFTANEVAQLAASLHLTNSRESVRKSVWQVAEKTGREKVCNVTKHRAQTFRWPNGGSA